MNRIRDVVAAVLLLIPGSGCDSNPVAASTDVRLEVQQTIHGVSRSATLDLTNLTDAELLFHPCDVTIQQRTGRIWETRRPNGPVACQADAPRRVAAGETRRYTLGLHENVRSGPHRFTQEVVLHGQRIPVLSSEFDVSKAALR